MAAWLAWKRPKCALFDGIAHRQIMRSARFHFTFSNESKQSYGNIIRFILFKLGSKKLGLYTLLKVDRAFKDQQASLKLWKTSDLTLLTRIRK